MASGSSFRVCRVCACRRASSITRNRRVVGMVCTECGCAANAEATASRAYRIDDPRLGQEPELAFYCPACGVEQFGSLLPRHRDCGGGPATH